MKTESSNAKKYKGDEWSEYDGDVTEDRDKDNIFKLSKIVHYLLN